jgi:hypothetical protein
MSKSRNTWQNYSIEFLSVFIAVISAFALNNWNDNRRENRVKVEILEEIHAGLQKDKQDIAGNKLGHEWGIKACKYFRNYLLGKSVDSDSVTTHFISLTRDFVAIQNTAGYETLKSTGLQVIDNDSLRAAIIELYEYDFKVIEKLEEEYSEMQYFSTYAKDFERRISEYLIFDDRGIPVGLRDPDTIDQRVREEILLILFRIEFNRNYILPLYTAMDKELVSLSDFIEQELP